MKTGPVLKVCYFHSISDDIDRSFIYQVVQFSLYLQSSKIGILNIASYLHCLVDYNVMTRALRYDQWSK